MLGRSALDMSETTKSETANDDRSEVNTAAKPIADFARTHRLRFAALALAIVFSLLDWYPMWAAGAGLPGPEISVMIALIMSMLIAMVDLRRGAVLAALAMMASVPTGGVLGTSWADWAQYALIGLLAFEVNAASAVALGMIAIASATGFVSLHTWMLTMPLAGWVGDVMMTATPLFIGLTFRWRADAQEAETRLRLRERELAQLQRDLQLVHVLHDTVAGRLAFVSAFSEQRASSQAGADTQNADTQSWKLVNEETADALHSVWQAVRVLSAESSRSSEKGTAAETAAVDDGPDACMNDCVNVCAGGHTSAVPDSVVHRMTWVSEDWSHRLDLLNLHGAVRISGSAARCDEKVGELAEQLLGELFVNILKYAKRSEHASEYVEWSDKRLCDDYLIAITCSDSGIHITQTNAIAPDDGRSNRVRIGNDDDTVAGGDLDNGDGVDGIGTGIGTGAQAGLPYYQRRLQDIGGSLSYAAIDDSWMLQAAIPTHAAAVHI
ncbi:hypothetical protein D2E23_1974 [Bifidobacterium callimiconis]|uniref:Histidine kinase n=2 Tax=Bifidobacterium callimiconis TaxID=2306973 RepID=A0A430FB02_9BIFI|nr:hypothetical protein D2E23_1974 [Bifidobacterium callimiconis]